MENLITILETWWYKFIENIPAIIAGILIFVLAIYLARLFSRMLRKAMKKRNSDPEITVLLSRIIRWTIIILGLLLALEQAGQDISALLAGLGIVGFTIGFALQDVSSNLVAGLLLLYQQPFDIGDAIEVAGSSGTVMAVDLRATEILTFDGLLVMIPNKDIYTSTITNYTRTSRRRIEHSIGISYDNDVESVQRLLLDKLDMIDCILKDPSPEIKFENFGGTTLDLTIYVWYNTETHGYVEVNNISAFGVKQALDQANIEMPFPTQTVILRQDS